MSRKKVDVTFQVLVTLDTSEADAHWIVEDLENYIRDSLELDYSPDSVEIDIREVDEYDA